jgi:hypothetical protein
VCDSFHQLLVRLMPVLWLQFARGDALQQGVSKSRGRRRGPGAEPHLRRAGLGGREPRRVAGAHQRERVGREAQGLLLGGAVADDLFCLRGGVGFERWLMIGRWLAEGGRGAVR